jgi:hypothetical protein
VVETTSNEALLVSLKTDSAGLCLSVKPLAQYGRTQAYTFVKDSQRLAAQSLGIELILIVVAAPI